MDDGSEIKSLDSGSFQAVTIMCDGVDGIALHANVIRMNMYTIGFDALSQKLGRLPACRLCMPLQEFVAFANAAKELADRLAGSPTESEAATSASSEKPSEHDQTG